MLGGLEVVAGSQLADDGFEGGLVYRNDFVTAQAGEVMVVLGEFVAEFDFVFPANVDTGDDTEFFEDGDDAVEAGPVELVFCPGV